mmetsp:Transcript_12279/g.26014  ORF Transcript_12279/g.26014 Transcript_12279/m.26014 type:complete len:98 (-) Transcript_12279:116-409(-)|eukprot:CAMPEP_0201137680 /NCGR_PEP_ID=MMETSP0850-20130426/55537_1 /ASSEMBLY_ACC=CAM_ASM_000622 /TAXON_ID=183588 /ORGANISM="Pseudo-nitzschia fraudulenta, Strain WWA7" /LENGTH=97 /DNA_ID=CAMNT_0047409047 /DNA_START=101 /DNA_END=394 /DNA_ORIENTATION=+
MSWSAPATIRLAAAAAAAGKRSLSSSSSSSAAGRLIQRRATTGSVSSVFYLKSLANKNPKQKQQATFVENIFTGLVGLPIAVLGLGGAYRMASEGKL